MLGNVSPISELRATSSKRLRQEIAARLVPQSQVQECLQAGWTVDRQVGRKVRVVKPKPHSVLLEDRVWSLLYRMGFDYLSGDGGAKLAVDLKDPAGPSNQIDVVGFDPDVAVAIECKSAESPGKKPDFDKDIAKHATLHPRFINAANQQYASDTKRVGVLVLFTNNILVTEPEKAKAKASKIVLFDEKDLDYYEKLVAHLGPAARYQFFADLLPGRAVPGLEIKLPAIKGKMGGINCYTFSISPDRLLKMAYVSHRARGRKDSETYQRMVTKTRLRKIQQYIDKKGNFFPTNIVLNLERTRNSLQFHPTTQEADEGNGVMGWLTIRPTYGSAWVIDGQHRLFAYSGHPEAGKSLLSVIAFEGLSSSQQARLFVDINHEQKSVARNHLYELFAYLHKDAEDPMMRIDAVVSKAILSFDADTSSPLFGRIVKTDDQKTAARCLTIQTLFSALSKPGFYISKQHEDGSVLAHGALWASENAELTIERTRRVLNAWFGTIRDGSPQWWDLGCADGGGLAMNDSIAACINVLRSVFQHLEKQGKVPCVDDDDLVTAVTPFGQLLADYFKGFTPEQRDEWRNYRGVQGQTARMRRCQEVIHHIMPDFNPPGLQEFLDIMQAETNTRAKDIIDRIERRLQNVVVSILKTELGPDDSGWWSKGVPLDIRIRAMERREEDNYSRGGQENYFDLIDYRRIATKKWLLFQDVLGYGKGNWSKDKRTEWINDLNERRKIVMHASSGQYVTLEQLVQLEKYDEWFALQLNGQWDV